MALFGSHARGTATAMSNVDVLIFQNEMPAAGWGVDRWCLDAWSVKVDILPEALMRSPALLSGTIEHEVYFSTVNEAVILFDPHDRFARYAERVRAYPEFLRRSVALARAAKLFRARKVVAKAVFLGDAAVYQAFAPQVLEHAAHLKLALAGEYASRAWLDRLRLVDRLLHSAVCSVYERLGLASHERLATVIDLIEPEFERACAPLTSHVMANRGQPFRALLHAFRYVEPYDLETLLRRTCEIGEPTSFAVG